jgi:di/tricarboxylate transporter
MEMALQSPLSWGQWFWAAGLCIIVILALYSIFKLIEKIVRG